MFGPDANVDPLKRLREPVASTSQLRQKPPEIAHSNTRLPEPDDSDNTFDSSRSRAGGSSRAGASSPTRSRVAAAIEGTPYRPQNDMPTFNDYSLVAALPSPSPEQLGPHAISQLMTWGSIMSTPRALGVDSADPLETSSSSAHPPNAFKIHEPKKRDDIGRRLATDASKSMRARSRGMGGGGLKGLALGKMGPPATPLSSAVTPKSNGIFSQTPVRKHNADSLTPAGRSLLERSMGTTPLSSSRSALQSGTVGARGGASRGRVEAMERAGGWSNLGKGGSAAKQKEPSSRSWTPSPAARRG